MREALDFFMDLVLYTGISLVLGGWVSICVNLWRRRRPPAHMTFTADDWHKANDKANHLLLQWLSPEQLADFARYEHFDVVGSHSRALYRIHYHNTLNVEPLGGSNTHLYFGRLCFGPLGVPHFGRLCFGPLGVPLGDLLLAQKIALETDEPGALDVANFRSATFGPREVLFSGSPEPVMRAVEAGPLYCQAEDAMFTLDGPPECTSPQERA